MKPSKRVLIGMSLTLIVFVSVLGIALMSMNSDPLTIEFVPDHANTIPDDMGWFLVKINTDVELSEYDIEISTNATIRTEYVYWAQTQLIEVFVYPTSSNLNQCIEVKLTFTSGLTVTTDSAFLYIWNWISDKEEYAIEMRDVFVDYLALNYPEFGINETTEWTPIYNTAGILIVTHYLFMSEQWEMEVAWHVMTPPSDWVHVYLRQRCDLTPSWGGEIVSWSSDNDAINEVDPPIEIYRAL